MKTNEFTRKASDGTNLLFREWLPEGNLKGVICLVHGLGDHSGWYKYLVSFLNDNCYGVIAFDLRGHGKSEGKRGHTPSYEIFLDDIDILCSEATERFHNIPLFLYGHSFGGNLVLNYVLHRHPCITGVITTAPWLSLVYEPSKLKLCLTSLIDKIWPGFTQDSRIDAKGLSHDPDIVDSYTRDPLVHGFMSARLFTGASKSGLWAIEHAGDFDLPLLLLHGNEDRITSHEASRKFAENAKDDICTFKVFEGLYHSLHNEATRQDIFLYILNWLNSKIEIPAEFSFER